MFELDRSFRESDLRTVLNSVLQKAHTIMTTNAAFVSTLQALTASVEKLGVEVAALKAKPASVVTETVVQTVVSDEVSPDVEAAGVALGAAITAVEDAVTAP